MSAEIEAQEELPETEADEVVLADRYRILPAARLTELDQAGSVAVVASDQRNPGDSLFARICAADVVPRYNIMEDIHNLREANLLRPLEWGPVEWPGSSEPRFAVVFQRPDGPPLMSSHKSKINPLTSEDLSRKILAPAVSTLQYMKPRGLTHRAIRPENIYYTGGKKSSTILGDCVTTPPASLQPAMFETIEMAMTSPIGRGPGLVCDDIYALGATILILSMGESPVKDMRDRDLLAAKIARGSFSALMGNQRPPFGLRELLRGMLSDDPLERWGLDELEQWLGGSLRRSVQQGQAFIAKRPFVFAGGTYEHTRLIAQAFGEKWENAPTAVRAPEFEKWLRRNAPDAGMADAVKGKLQGDDEKAKASSALVSHVCMTLDHKGPIRYKGLNSMPEGIGVTMAFACLRKDQKKIQTIAECIAAGIPLDWFAAQSETDQMGMEFQIASHKRVQQQLRQTGPGYGIERILYELNAYLPCLSPMLAGRYVASIRGLLPALEEIVRDRGSLPTLVDRHLAAFIASRIRHDIDRSLIALEERKGNPVAAKLGMLKLFARVQTDYGPESLPYITEWLARELEPAVAQFHSKSRRETLGQKLEGVARGGDLAALNSVINDDVVRRQDDAECKLAMRELSAASRQIATLQSKEFHDSNRRAGWQIAAVISMCIGFIAMGFVVFY